MTPLLRLILLIGLLVLNVCSYAAKTLPDELSLVYQLKFGVLNLGTVTKRIVRQGNRYRLSSTTQASPLVKAIRDVSLSETALFTIEDGELRPIEYTVERRGAKAYTRSVKFDWARRSLQYADGRIEAMPPGRTLDLGSLPFAIMLQDPQTLSGMKINVADGKRVRTWQAVDTRRENISTPLGRIAALRVEQHRTNQKDRALVLWLDPARDYLPVRIANRKGKRVSTLDLIQLQSSADLAEH